MLKGHCTTKNLLRFLTVLVFIFSLIGFLSSIRKARAEQLAFDELESELEGVKYLLPDVSNTEVTGQSHILQQYSELYKKNGDLAGWLRVEGTNINYPVMFTPDDIEYYLRRAFDGSYSYSGVPFIGYGCSLNPKSDNLVIYGHNMDNGSMFHDLLMYADEKFWAEQPTILFDTLSETGVYEVVAAFYSQIYPENCTTAFRYYQYVELDDPSVFSAFVSNVKNAALYDTGVTPKYGDSLITLSTCSYHTDNGRFAVVARLAA